MDKLIELGQIVRETRKRTGNGALGTRANKGRLDVVEVTYDERGRSTVRVLRGGLSFEEAVEYLRSL